MEKAIPYSAGFLVCSREREKTPLFFPTIDTLTHWVNEDPMIRAYCEYIELTSNEMRNLILDKGYTTYAFRVWKR